MISIEAYRAAIGCFYPKSKRLSYVDEFHTNMSCFFSAYLNYLIIHFNKIFGVFLLEFYDSSFLKRFKVLIDGDVESNPGPTDNIENTPTRCKGRPKGTPKKSRGFRGTPKKIITNSPNICNNVENGPIGLVNIANDCFFNSVIQALFTLSSFRNHVRNFDTMIPNELNAVCSIKQLFRDMEAKSNDSIQTHDCLMSLGLPGHIENRNRI